MSKNGDTDPLADRDAESANDTDENEPAMTRAKNSLRATADDLDERLPWSRQDVDRAGAKAGDTVAGIMRAIVINIMLFASKVIPGSNRMWQGCIRAGFSGLVKTSSADAVGVIMEEGQMRHVPVKYDKEGGESPEINDGRWVTADGDWWKAPNEGQTTYLVPGKNPTPAIWASSSANQLGNHVQAEVAEVLDAGGEQPLMTDAKVNVTMDATGAAAGEAVADGGQQQWQTYATVEDPGMLEDMLVDLSHEADGRVVSAEKYYETYPSKVGPEEMEQQNLMGKLAERDTGAKLRFALIAMLIAFGIVAVVELGPPLVNAVFGGGGGGGGGGSTLLG